MFDSDTRLPVIPLDAIPMIRLSGVATYLLTTLFVYGVSLVIGTDSLLRSPQNNSPIDSMFKKATLV